MSKITVRDVSFAYKTTPILEQINMDIASGDFVCLLGQSGCGKSTFLRLMAGLEIPSGGEILVDGEPLLESGADRSMVFQDYSLFPWFTTGKNLLLALKQKYHRQSKKELVEKIRGHGNGTEFCLHFAGDCGDVCHHLRIGYIQYYADFSDYARVLAGLLFTTVVIVTIMVLFDRLKKKTLFWTINKDMG